MGCLMSHKSHDIAGAQASERDATFTETVFQETANKRHVTDDRRFGQATRFAQVRYICLYTAFDGRRSTRWDLLDGNQSLMAQKVDKVPDCSTILSVGSKMSSAIFEISSRVVSADAPYSDVPLFKPLAKVRCNTHLPMQGICTVSLFTQCSRK